MVTRFQLPLPEGQILALSRRMMALSPDGRDIAFVTDNQLFVRRLADFEAVPLDAAIAAHLPQAAGHIHHQVQGGLLTPLLTQTDGFYIFIARRH